MYIITDNIRLFIDCFCAFVCQYRIELCQFSGYKIQPGHGKRYVRLDGKVRNSKEVPGTCYGNPVGARKVNRRSVCVVLWVNHVGFSNWRAPI